MKTLIVTGAAVLAFAAGNALALSPVPSLRVTAKAPLTVRGLHFRSGEQVVITVFHGKSLIRRLKATTTGVFVARFPSIEIGECDAYGLRAIGSKGSFASFKTPRYMCGAQPEAGG